MISMSQGVPAKQRANSKLVVVGLLIALTAAGCLITTKTTNTSASEPARPVAASLPSEPLAPEIQPGLIEIAPRPENVSPPTPGKNGLPPTIHSIETKDRVVFLTIDDGNDNDPKSAQMLGMNQVPLTSFLYRNAMSKRVEYYRNIGLTSGQVIQNHTISHPMLAHLPEKAQRTEICDTNASFGKWFGADPWMLRPPYGSYNNATLKAAQECGIQYVVLWNTVLEHQKIQHAPGGSWSPGDIVLVHWTPELSKDLSVLFADLKAAGFKIASLQDYLPRRETTPSGEESATQEQ